MKFNLTWYNITLAIVIIIIIVLLIDNYFLKDNEEGFKINEKKYKLLEDTICSSEYQKKQLRGLLVYHEEVYPILDKISQVEIEFIYNYIKNSSVEDIKKDNHVSPYTYCINVKKIDGKINSSRFAFGTKTNHKELEKNIKDLAQEININLPDKKHHLWYGVGWDLEDKLIKFYTISKDSKTMTCYVYNTERDNESNIKQIKYNSKKKYDVNKDVTYMHKDGKTIEQHNNVPKIDNVYYKKYPKITEIINDMNNRGFVIDTYSEYNDTLNIYFD